MSALTQAGRRKEIVCFGDSITEQGWGIKGGVGWVSLLSEAYRRRADVYNRGFGGYNTRTLGPIVRRTVGAARAAGARFGLATLFLGANDANTQAEQHVPLEEYQRRLEGMALEVAGVSDCIVVIGPGPVDNRRWPSRSNAAAAAYCGAARTAVAAAAAAAAAKGATLLFVSLFEAATGGRQHAPEGSEAPIAVAASPALQWVDALSDGLHLSSVGNAALAEAVLRAVREGCPAAAPEAWGEDFPHWLRIAVGPGEEAHAFFSENKL
jgi:lysophospholipase L1-like esterase